MKVTKAELFTRSGQWVDITAAFSALAEGAGRAAQAFSAFGRAFMRVDPLEARRSRFGGMQSDLERWPDRWQSFHCAGFLHEGCLSQTHDLRCTCHCHD